MESKQYSVLSDLYAYLMRKIDYEDWAEYLFAIFRKYAVKDDKIMEIGGGLGTIASHLNKYFPKIYLSDLSIEMLRKCNNDRLIKLCFDMRAIPIKKKFDIIYSTFDTINYLMSEEDLGKFFNGIYAISNKDTIVTLDASLERNSIKYGRFLNRKGKFNDISFEQKSRYDKNERIHYNSFEILLPDGKVINEIHAQKIYEFDKYFDIIDKCGLYVVDCFDAFSFEKATDQSIRAQFVIKKKR